MRRGWVLLALCLVILAGGGQQKPRSQLDLEALAASDPRIEVVARALCRAHGLDPDHDSPPYPGPLWERFIIQAHDYLVARDTYDEWQKHIKMIGK